MRLIRQTGYAHDRILVPQTVNICEELGAVRERDSQLSSEAILAITGKRVTYTFFPGDPLFVSHGEFRVENRSSRVTTCVVTSCAFGEIGRVLSIRLDDIYLYTDDRKLSKTLTIAPLEGLDFRVTFPV